MLRATARIRIENRTNCMREARKARFAREGGATGRCFLGIEVGYLVMIYQRTMRYRSVVTQHDV